MPLAGVIGLSGVVCISYDNNMKIKEPSMQHEFSDQKIQQMQKTPLFLYLGERDNYFDVHVAELTYDVLKFAYTDKTTQNVSDNYMYNREKGLEHSIS